jgi:hypothetical protein
MSHVPAMIPATPLKVDGICQPATAAGTNTPASELQGLPVAARDAEAAATPSAPDSKNHPDGVPPEPGQRFMWPSRGTIGRRPRKALPSVSALAARLAASRLTGGRASSRLPAPAARRAVRHAAGQDQAADSAAAMAACFIVRGASWRLVRCIVHTRRGFASQSKIRRAGNGMVATAWAAIPSPCR